MLNPLDIALVRVDNRLVHGQILEAWVPYIRASCIVVVDDQVADDFFRETVIRMAVPRDIRVVICRVSDFPERLDHNIACGGAKTIVLFSNIADATRVFQAGFRYRRLNIGNLYNDKCKICCTPSVQLSHQDLLDVEWLHQAGVDIELRRVPREKHIDFFEFFKGASNHLDSH